MFNIFKKKLIKNEKGEIQCYECEDFFPKEKLTKFSDTWEVCHNGSNKKHLYCPMCLDVQKYQDLD